MNLVEEADYQSIKINTVKFIEVNENEEQLNNMKGTDKGGEKLKETELDPMGVQEEQEGKEKEEQQPGE